MAVSQTNFAWATLLDVGSPDRRYRLHDRLARALRAAIRAGRLAEGAAVPPSRALAEELGCSRWVVTEAYGQLVAEGYLAARTGSATRVSWAPEAPPARPSPGAATAAPPLRYDLAPGLPDLRAFPRRRWADAVHAAASTASRSDLARPDLAGHPRLRHTVAAYLRRSRGAEVAAGAVTVCAGVADGVSRVCRALRLAGIAEVAVEEPGWGRLRDAAAGAGVRVHPVPVDGAGLRVDELAATPARAVVVAAAHQFPTGTVLSPARRTHLVRWARDVDGLVLEDDYDAEFRYDRQPVAVVQGMAPHRVALFGSVSKTLSPALGLGWFAVPEWLRPAVAAANPVAAAPPVPDQLALAAFVDRGWYDAHLRAARRRFRARRELLLRALAEQVPQGRVTGTAAGLHVLLHLPDGTDTRSVVRTAEAAGLRLADLDDYRGPGAPGAALVLGYGNLADADVGPAVALLRDAVGTGHGRPAAPPHLGGPAAPHPGRRAVVGDRPAAVRGGR